MPVPCQIDPHYSVLHAKCLGEVTFQEILYNIDLLEQDPLCTGRLDVLLDVSDLETIPDKTQLASL